jgi:hypothetical protein
MGQTNSHEGKLTASAKRNLKLYLDANAQVHARERVSVLAPNQVYEQAPIVASRMSSMATYSNYVTGPPGGPLIRIAVE